MTLFRVIGEQHPLLLIDDAELLVGRDEHARCLRAVLDEGFKGTLGFWRADLETEERIWDDLGEPKPRVRV